MLKDVMMSIAFPLSHAPDDVIGKLRNREREMKMEATKNPYPVRRNTSSRNTKKTLSVLEKPDPTNIRLLTRTRSDSLPKLSYVHPENFQVKKSSNQTSFSKSSPINILVIGGKHVGKSALTVRFITRRFIGDYMSGESMSYNYTSPDERRNQQVTFLDWSDEEDDGRTFSLDESNFTWADGIIVVYDVGNPETFTYAKNIVNDVICKNNSQKNDHSSLSELLTEKQSLNKEVKPILLIGNKIDLVKRRSISKCDISAAAEEFPPWVTSEELSAADKYDDVGRCITDLISRVRRQRRHSCGSSTKENIRNLVDSVFRSSFRPSKRRTHVKFGSM